MAFKKESLAAILVKIGVYADQAKALEAISAEAETDVVIPEGTRIYSKADWEGDGSDDKPGIQKTLQSEGIKIGKELQVKELKEKAGLTFDGKSPEKFIEEYKAAVMKEAGQSVDEKVKSRDTTISELRKALGEEKEGRQADAKRLEQKEMDFELIKLLPKDRDSRFTDSQYLTLMRSELEFGKEEDKPVVKKAGAVLKNDKFEPLGYGDAIAELFTKSNWIVKKDEGGGDDVHGRGGGSGKPAPAGKFANIKELNAYLEANNIPVGSSKATELMRKAVADNPEFDTKTIV